MPYKSDKQRRWAHTAAGKRALGTDKVEEFDKTSKGKNLPEKAKKKPRTRKKTLMGR